jgi:hypothetical protein
MARLKFTGSIGARAFIPFVDPPTKQDGEKDEDFAARLKKYNEGIGLAKLGFVYLDPDTHDALIRELRQIENEEAERIEAERAARPDDTKIGSRTYKTDPGKVAMRDFVRKVLKLTGVSVEGMDFGEVQAESLEPTRLTMELERIRLAELAMQRIMTAQLPSIQQNFS